MAFEDDSSSPSGPAPAAAVVRDAETLELLNDFLEETGEALTQADENLMPLEREEYRVERVHTAFRVFHSMKGSAGFLDLTDFAALAHSTESALNALRSGAVTNPGPTVELALEATALAREMLGVLRRAVQAGTEIARHPSFEPLMARIEALVAGTSSPARAAPQHIAPQHVAPSQAAPPHVAPSQAAPPSRRSARTPQPTPSPRAPTLPAAGRRTDAEPPPKRSRPAAAAKAEAAPERGKVRETLKVDVDRVDAMVDLVGEMLVAQAMVLGAKEVAGVRVGALDEALSEMSRITASLQDVALRMRMIPLRGVFQRMERFARELSRRTGKLIDLQTSGDTTEMDRHMAEGVTDPLMHLLNNAVDHGIELPDERVRRGKPEAGVIRLRAFAANGQVVIEIKDDGQGLQADRIFAKAVERKLVAENARPSDSDLFRLIFAPGFSTAPVVTQLSGRGVGMDVVKRAVEGMRGTVNVASEPGKGTTFQLQLPLTLALQDGMQVSVKEDAYVVPTQSIEESIELGRHRVTTHGGHQRFVVLHDVLVPLYPLATLLDRHAEVTESNDAVALVVRSGEHRIALMVDDIMNPRQYVVKPLAGTLSTHRFAGATILADGRVSLILNVDGLTEAVRASRASVDIPVENHP